MKKFIVGFMLGVLCCVVVVFHLNAGKEISIYTGRLLDRDTIYLDDGSVIKGWITGEDDRQLWIEQENGYFGIERSRCKKIIRNTLLLYTKELI